jgi:hypothetical protein
VTQRSKSQVMVLDVQPMQTEHLETHEVRRSSFLLLRVGTRANSLDSIEPKLSMFATANMTTSIAPATERQ